MSRFPEVADVKTGRANDNLNFLHIQARPFVSGRVSTACRFKPAARDGHPTVSNNGDTADGRAFDGSGQRL